MIFLSLVTSVKDYVEVLHKLVETNSTNGITSYYDLGASITFFTLTFKETFLNFLSLKWLQDIWSIPILIPNISYSMISEISIFNGIFENTFSLLDKPLSYGNNNLFLYCFEKFIIGLLNSLFLCLATSTSSLITLRRFVMQGLEAGYIAGLGSIAGNIVWIGSIIFGFRFVVIPWLSLDIFRYVLGFILLLKYMWDSYSERRSILTNLSKTKIFTLNFLLAFTEQTNIFPFLSNLSLSSDSTILENFPTLTNSSFEFLFIHSSYLFGLLLGSFSLLQFTCWFWENPAYNFYMWTISSFKVTTTFYSKLLNFVFLYLTMICTINSVGYFGLDYTLTNPLGFVHEDRLIEQKMLLETSFLNSKASDRNTRRNRGRHGRRERWKRRVRLYRTFDASLYDQGIYDLFTIEDLNYGFDRFWLRRKIRNHRVRFRFFPGPWMRSLKKQFARPRLESFMGPRIEFFRILFEQAYHPEFHEFKSIQKEKILLKTEKNNMNSSLTNYSKKFLENSDFSLYSLSQSRISYDKKDYYSNIGSNSFLRKFLRKLDNRIKFNQSIKKEGNWLEFFNQTNNNISSLNFPILKENSLIEQNLFEKFSKNLFKKNLINRNSIYIDGNNRKNGKTNFLSSNMTKKWSKSDKFLTEYKNLLKTNNNSNTTPLTLLHPLKFYFQKDEAFRKKCRFYGVKQYRSYGVENNAPYFRVMMKRFFYYYKPTLRWERTMRVATMRKARRKNSRIPRIPLSQRGSGNNENSLLNNQISKKNTEIFSYPNTSEAPFEAKSNSDLLFIEGDSKFSNEKNIASSFLQKPTHFYSLVSKKANRYRYQIYKDVLQHWYYSKMNRLLLKFDVDSFIRRQPKTHFLTKNEETNLHIKRYLIFEYYNTLRWYNFMQHYNTMKTSLGKTKSFSNRAYNQQFYGTFKKIRHLFAITPSFDQGVLKFDQLLYNEFPNSLKKDEFGRFENTPSKFIQSGIIADSFIHEELKSIPEVINENKNSIPTPQIHPKGVGVEMQSPEKSEIPRDIISLAKMSIFYSLKEKTSTNKKTVESFLIEKDYTNLTRFLLKENSQEQNKPFLESLSHESFLNQSIFNKNNEQQISQYIENFHENIWFTLLKKSQNKLYDQKALKNFVLSKVEKHEKKVQKKQKILFLSLEKLKTWYQSTEQNLYIDRNLGFSSTIQKAMKEALNSSNYDGSERLVKKRKKRVFSTPYPTPSVYGVGYNFNLENSCNNLNMQKCAENFSNTEMIISNTKQNLKTKSVKILKGNILKNISFALKKETRKLKFFYYIEKLFSATFHFNKKYSPILDSKSGNNWRQVEKILSKRKKIRKTFKRLKNVQNFSFIPQRGTEENFLSLQFQMTENIFKNNETRKKVDNLNNKVSPQKFAKSISEKKQRNWYTYNKKEKDFSLEWKKRRSRIRRYRFFKGRGPIKKRTLGEKLKNKFRFLKKYGLITEKQTNTIVSKDSKNFLETKFLDKNIQKTYNAIFETLSQNSSNLSNNDVFEMRPMKQSRTLSKKHRYWKKHKKPIFAQNKRKLRKRRRYLKAKIRVLTKKWKNIEFQLFFKKWWWKNFIPNMSQKKLERFNDFSLKDHNGLISLGPTKNFVLNSNYFENQTIDSSNSALLKKRFSETISTLPLPQRGRGKAYPLKTSDNLNNKSFVETITIKPNFNENSSNIDSIKSKNKIQDDFIEQPQTLSNNDGFGLNQVLKNLYSQPQNIQIIEEYSNSQSTQENRNNTPFYAGWDEDSRKFVLTNRLLSRKSAGYFVDSRSNIYDSKNHNVSKFQSFLNSMNAATTLYWQIPFTTYDPDQFFALGMDGFSPIGWRNFKFQFSQRTTKPILVKKMTTLPNFSLSQNNKNFYTEGVSYTESLWGIKILETKFPRQFSETKNNLLNNQRFNQTNQYRRIQKRYKRVKKHPRPPVWFPSGPLSTQILPVHYIYVFYKRYRLPRDRYVRRRLRGQPTESFASISKTQTNFSNNLLTKNNNIYNYTLRKRVKPKRKYHRKVFAFSRKNENMVDTILRRQFRGVLNEKNRFRPSTSFILSKNENLERKDKIKTRKKSENKTKLSNKSSRENLRLRQLRRRVQRQVFRPVWRYKPQTGGFIWPGDYLRLDSIKAPKLTSKNSNILLQNESIQKTTRKIRKKKRRMIPEWQIQPKKYLIQKHNVKVLKKRLEKSQKKI